MLSCVDKDNVAGELRMCLDASTDVRNILWLWRLSYRLMSEKFRT